MAEERRSLGHIEEIRALRTQVAELERQLGEDRRDEAFRVPGFPDADTNTRVRTRVAERAIDGFFEQSLVMMIIADLVEGRFLRINQKVCDVLGLSEWEILESSFLDRVHPDDIPGTIREMGRLTAGQRTTDFQNRHLGTDGKYHVFKWTAVADENHELCYAMAIEIADET